MCAGECGYHGGSCDFSLFNATALQLAKNAVYSDMVRALNKAGIVPILSLDNRLAASGVGTSAPAPCAVPADDLLSRLQGTRWVRFYEKWPQSFWAHDGPDLAAAMVQNAILEGAAGVPTVLHSGGACPAPERAITRPGPLGGDVQYAMALYLVVATPGTAVSLSDGWYDASFCWRQDFDVDVGEPLGDAVRTGPYTWVRNWTRANAAVDVNTSRGDVWLLA